MLGISSCLRLMVEKHASDLFLSSNAPVNIKMGIGSFRRKLPAHHQAPGCCLFFFACLLAYIASSDTVSRLARVWPVPGM